MVAQEQALRTNLVREKIGKTQGDSKYRMCSKADHLSHESGKMAKQFINGGMTR